MLPTGTSIPKKKQRTPWQEFIVMGIHLSLFFRLQNLIDEGEPFELQKLKDAGLIVPEEEGKGVLAYPFDNQYRNLLSFIEDNLHLNFFDATRWALDFIERTPAVENDDCRCDEQGTECDHENGGQDA